MADEITTITPKHPGGRPPISEIQKREIVSKLEPYLKSGLNISKALGEAHVSKATFYRLMDEDEQFRDKINQYRNFVPILLNNLLTRHLMELADKQNGNPARKIKAQKLSQEDLDFLWKFALNSNLTKGEFGERKSIQLFDPEAELQKLKGIIEEASSKEIEHPDDEPV